MKKPVSPAIKKQAEEFSNTFLSLEKGLKDSMVKQWVKEGVLSFSVFP
jgi:hypothetical protein